MFHLYIIEAIGKSSHVSVAKKYHTEHKYDKPIYEAMAGGKPIVKYAPTAADFQREIEEFGAWQAGVTLGQADVIILWLSVHGNADDVTEVRFDNDDTLDYEAIFKPLRKGLQQRVVVLQSICWGGFPGITRVMNNKAYGPMLMFGPTIAVRIPALHRAENEVLRFLAVTPNPTAEQLHRFIDERNAWGAQHHPGHDRYYRVWYWGDKSEHDLRRHPEG